MPPIIGIKRVLYPREIDVGDAFWTELKAGSSHAFRFQLVRSSETDFPLHGASAGV